MNSALRYSHQDLLEINFVVLKLSITSINVNVSQIRTDKHIEKATGDILFVSLWFALGDHKSRSELLKLLLGADH